MPILSGFCIYLAEGSPDVHIYHVSKDVVVLGSGPKMERPMYVVFTALCLISQSWSDDAPTIQRDAPTEVMPSKAWDFTHLHLDLSIQPSERTISGTATHSVRPLTPHNRTVRMHQNHLDIEEVWVDGVQTKEFRVTEGMIDIAVSPNTPHNIVVHYTASPETGLHFRTLKAV